MVPAPLVGPDNVATTLGPAGAHARSAIGVAALPLGSPVEPDAVVAASRPQDRPAP
jgi:hypothetical protein